MTNHIYDHDYLSSRLTKDSLKKYYDKFSTNYYEIVNKWTYEGLGAGLTTNGFTKEFDIPLTYEQEETL